MSDTLHFRKHREDREDRDPSSVRRGVPASKLDTEIPVSPSRQLAQVEHDLGRNALLRFSEAVERTFQDGRRPARVRHYVAVGIFGVLAFDLFLIPDALIIPDILRRAEVVELGVITPIAALQLYLVRRRVLPPESSFFIMCMTYGTAIWAASASQAPNAVFLLFTLPIFFVFSNIALPLPFRHAAVYSAMGIFAVIWAVSANPRLDVGIKVLMFMIELSMGIYTLMATYRLEIAERRSYLLTLRETLRGEALLEKNRELSQLSETDGLTGVANRRVFDRTLQNLWAEHLLSQTPIALLMIDIDNFKRLNDTYGHGNGDLCLKKTAIRLRSLMHAHQSLARYGGEEFAVLLEGEGARKAVVVAERLRAEIEAMPIALTGGGDGPPHHITISVGCATVVPRLGLSPMEIFLAADKALYAAKRAGRNRVQVQALEPSSAIAQDTAQDTPLAAFDTLSRN